MPPSIEDPITTNANNIDCFLNMVVAARDPKVKRFAYAACSSTYGDHPDLPKVVNELYADVFAKTYGMECIGVRFF